MTLEKFVDITFKEGEYGTCFRKKIICNDGFNMSVQGSQFHYCSPRKNQNWYNSMEVGFPSEKEELMPGLCLKDFEKLLNAIITFK